MLLYTDIISGDELITDAFDLKVVDDIVYEVDGKLISVKEGDVDIGANPSAEEQEESLESNEEKIINIIHSNRLSKTTFDKKSYLSYLKDYMKKIAEKLPEDRKEAFKSGAQAYAKKVVANFKDFEFYTGETMDPEGMVILVNYREDGITPYFIFWKDGLKEVKL